ncbi:MAG: alpha/beta hydrolase-fold protein, partial [Myxococcota bacterium]
MHTTARCSLRGLLCVLPAFLMACPRPPSVETPLREQDGRTLRLEVALPDALPANGMVSAYVVTAEEAEEGLGRDPRRFLEFLQRVQVMGARSDRRFVVELEAPPGDVHAHIFFDTAALGLEVFFGPRPGVASGHLELSAGTHHGELTLEGEPFAEPREACGQGPREELVVLQAPETAREGDSGEQRLCVYRPASYGDGEERYPVLFALPGYSGSHIHGDAFGARTLVDRLSHELGVAVLLVGVATRTPEGTSYLDRSPRFGDWDRYLSERVITEIDRRYRTLPRRAVFGHSTGGWNAIHWATHHPELFAAVGASSADALDLDRWLLEDGHVRPSLLSWMRVEDELEGRGQMVSYAASWSPANTPRGFAWPADLQSGVLGDVYEQWRRRSPIVELQQPEGLQRVRQLSGRIVITAGRNDEFDLFAPSESYVDALRAASIDVEWLPTELGHFGETEARFTELLRF